MNHIARNNRARLNPERVYSAHIRKPALTYIINQIVADFVVVCDAVSETPDPADRYCRIISVMNLIVADINAVGVDNENRHRVIKDSAVFLDIIIGNSDVFICSLIVNGQVFAPDINSLRPEILKSAGFNLGIPDARTHKDGARGNVFKLTMNNRKI